MSIFSERLVALRKEKGISQYEFAKIMSISRSTISGYESEGKEPTYTTLRRFAEYFGVSADYLLGLSDEMTHADVVFQKDSSNFKKHYTALPAEQKALVAEAFDDFYILMFRDVCAANTERLAIYRDLIQSISRGRSKVKKHIDGGVDSITSPKFLSDLMGMEESVKNDVASALDRLMQSDLDSVLGKGKK